MNRKGRILKIAFYGTASQVGTSANMAVVAEFFRCCQKIAMENYPQTFGDNTSIIFQDYGHKKDEIWNSLADVDLVVVNLPDSDRSFETLFFSNSLVQKNVIFLFGKYFHNDTNALIAFAKNYRIDMGRVCAIPYNLRFGQAYENHRLSSYLMQKKDSFEDELFKKNLWDVMRAILTYAGNNK